MARIVLRHNPSEHSQGEGNKGVERGNGKYCRKGQCTCGSMSQSDCIHPQEDYRHRSGEETSRKENATDPRLAIHLEIKSCRYEAANGTSEAVQNDESSKNGPTSCRGDEAGQCQSEEAEGSYDELHSSPNRSAEEDGELREAEDIAVNQLPPRL